MDVDIFRFQDSFHFLGQSLQNLTDDFTSRVKKRNMHILNQSKLVLNENGKFTRKSLLRRDLCLKKGFFPYEKLTDVNYLNQKSLPPKSHFFSTLTGKGISNKVSSPHANLKILKSSYQRF